MGQKKLGWEIQENVTRGREKEGGGSLLLNKSCVKDLGCGV